jgi:spermidine/putrescine transport system permease protein
LIAVSFASTNALGFPVYGLHILAYKEIAHSEFIPVFVRTIVFALVATLVCILIGYPVAYVIAMFGGRYRNLLILLAILPWFVDYLIRIYAWFEIVGPSGMLGNFLHILGLVGPRGIDLLATNYIVVGSLVYSYLPIMILAIYFTVEQLQKNLIEASKDLYGTPASTFFHVTLPNTMHGIIAGSLLVFLPCVGDFATASILGGPGQVMVGNLISGEVTSPGGLPAGAALTVLLVFLLAVAILLYYFLLRRPANRRAQSAWVGDVL